MLLVIDVGNTNTVMGALDGDRVTERWRVSTTNRTTDEVGLLLLQLLQHRGLGKEQLTGIVVSCVVPSVLYAIEKAARRYLDLEALVVDRGIKTGMKVRTDNPREVGADRIVNAVAAVARYAAPLVVVDFGTATTFDCVNHLGEYVGGAIAPGFGISADALFQRTAKLPRVELDRTASVIGTNTVQSMQAGLFWGYVGLVDELARRCRAELADLAQAATGQRPEVRCLATGGLANIIGGACGQIEEIDDDLTLQGMRRLWELNRGRARPR